MSSVLVSDKYHTSVAPKYQTIADDLRGMLARPDHAATFVGTATAPALSPEPLRVTGRFQLFVVDPTRVERRRMRYRATLTALNGWLYTLAGAKEAPGPGRRGAWSDLSTLPFTLYKGGRAKRKRIVATGVLRLAPGDFARQLATVAVRHADGSGQRLDALGDFVRFFGGVELGRNSPLFTAAEWRALGPSESDIQIAAVTVLDEDEDDDEDDSANAGDEDDEEDEEDVDASDEEDTSRQSDNENL